ncbi:MAG TPA: ATP-binding protein [Thermoanaerobaculia bacterium]|nr:ATP-binding protein [Thermoanaerobaculia bacterium]
MHWIQAKGSATFENGVAVRMAGIALDITQRKTLELEREELLSLERRLRAEADAASVAKDHFLALLSHELRTPMTTILGWASFLGTGISETDLLHKGIASIEKASRTQSRLIDDLLDVSRIVSGKMTLEKKMVDVAEMVRGAVEVILPAADAGSIVVRTDLGRGPAFLFADPIRIQQVIWNLLSNAVKFTPVGGEVRIAVRHREEAVEIEVRDTGIGIAPEFLPHVFERFRQADDGPTRRFGGLGLGFSIVRHLTELHGGSVHAASDGPGRGTELVVRLPAAVASNETATPPRDAAAPVAADALAGVNVLVVDDDPAARQVLGTILSAFGARVTGAASAREALQSVTRARPDVLVSDIGMPEEDGYDLIRLLRVGESLGAADVPAVAVTAYADPRDRLRALDAGFQAHVVKPVEPKVLAGAVLRVLRR